jgi:hypothetical protein
MNLSSTDSLKVRAAAKTAARLENLQEQGDESAAMQQETMELQVEANALQRKAIAAQKDNTEIQRKVLRVSWYLLALTAVLLVFALAQIALYFKAK